LVGSFDSVDGVSVQEDKAQSNMEATTNKQIKQRKICFFMIKPPSCCPYFAFPAELRNKGNKKEVG
jgi:hypothetical protein